MRKRKAQDISACASAATAASASIADANVEPDYVGILKRARFDEVVSALDRSVSHLSRLDGALRGQTKRLSALEASYEQLCTNHRSLFHSEVKTLENAYLPLSAKLHAAHDSARTQFAAKQKLECDDFETTLTMERAQFDAPYEKERAATKSTFYRITREQESAFQSQFKEEEAGVEPFRLRYSNALTDVNEWRKAMKRETSFIESILADVLDAHSLSDIKPLLSIIIGYRGSSSDGEVVTAVPFSGRICLLASGGMFICPKQERSDSIWTYDPRTKERTSMGKIFGYGLPHAICADPNDLTRLYIVPSASKRLIHSVDLVASRTSYLAGATDSKYFAELMTLVMPANANAAIARRTVSTRSSSSAAAAAATAEPSLYAIDSGNGVHCIHPRTGGGIIRSYAMKGARLFGAAFSGNVLYISSDNFEFLCLDIDSGEMERIPIRLCTNRPSPGLRGVSAGAVKKFFHSIVCLSNGLIIGSYGSYIDGDIVCTDGLYAIDLQRSGRAIQIAGFPGIAMHPNILHRK